MSLRFKTIVGIGLIEAVLLAILITTVLNYMRLTNEESLENYVETTSSLFVTSIKDAVLSYDLASLETFIEEMLTNQGVLYVRIFDSDKNLLGSGGMSEYLEKKFIADSNYSQVSDKVYDSSKPITVDGDDYGHIEMGISTERIETSIAETRRLAASIAVLEMLLVALFSFGLGSYLTSQLKALRNAARRIGSGDLTKTIKINSRDEIAEVAHSFNKMIRNLNEAQKNSKRYQQKILSLNKTLENRVKKRTEKILQQNIKMEETIIQLKQTQKQLVQSEKMASIGQLAAGVAHEINNPVAYVKSNLVSLSDYIKSYQLIIDSQEKLFSQIDKKSLDELHQDIQSLEQLNQDQDLDFINEDIGTLLQESIEGTVRVEEIVKGLKVYSRKSDDIMEKCDINECLEATLKLLNNEIKHKCDVTMDLNPIPLCLCNASKITQVFTNLIVNAVQAMEDHGQTHHPYTAY